MPSTDGTCADIVQAVPKIMQAGLYCISSRTVALAKAGSFSVSLLQYVNYIVYVLYCSKHIGSNSSQSPL